MARGLFDPLGTDREVKRGPIGISAPLLTSGVVLVILAALLIASVLRDDGSRGQPHAVSTIERVTAPVAASKPAAREAGPTSSSAGDPISTAEPRSASALSALPPVREDQDVEIQNGVRIIRPRRSGAAAGGQVLKVPAIATPNVVPQTRPAGSGSSSTP